MNFSPLTKILPSPSSPPQFTPLEETSDMGVQSKEHHHFPHQSQSSCFTRKLVSRTIYILLPLVFLHLCFFPRPVHHPPQQAPTAPSEAEEKRVGTRCDYSKGRWVRDESAGKIYNGTSCPTIKDGQNCLAHGRPDTGYLRWRWQPVDCSLPVFDPTAFLTLLRNKHLAFVGDSMARNQLESLVCLLSSASVPELVYNENEKFRKWRFHDYNATVSVYWSPFLVKGVEKNVDVGLDHNELYVDTADERWTKELEEVDVVLLSAGHWFLHPAVYYDKKGTSVIGCHYCPGKNYTEVGFYDVFKTAFKTALDGVVEEAKANGRLRHVVVTTFSPSHFEGEWDKAGACPRKVPYEEGEKVVEGMDAEMRRSQLEGVAAAAATTVEVEVLDVTKLALMRPDGHPAAYMYAFPFANGVPDRVQNDCVHWCLPGPIDTWNEILLEMVKRWNKERTF